MRCLGIIYGMHCNHCIYILCSHLLQGVPYKWTHSYGHLNVTFFCSSNFAKKNYSFIIFQQNFYKFFPTRRVFCLFNFHSNLHGSHSWFIYLFAQWIFMVENIFRFFAQYFELDFVYTRIDIRPPICTAPCAYIKTWRKTIEIEMLSKFLRSTRPKYAHDISIRSKKKCIVYTHFVLWPSERLFFVYTVFHQTMRYQQTAK